MDEYLKALKKYVDALEKQKDEQNNLREFNMVCAKIVFGVVFISILIKIFNKDVYEG